MIMRLKTTLLFLALCLLQMTPWVGEILVSHNSASNWIWWVGALISISVMWKIIQWTNAKGQMMIRLDLSGWHKRTVLYFFLVGLISYGIVFLLRLAIGGLEIIGMSPSGRTVVCVRRNLRSQSAEVDGWCVTFQSFER